jgi:hypothetical protein
MGKQHTKAEEGIACENRWEITLKFCVEMKNRVGGSITVSTGSFEHMCVGLCVCVCLYLQLCLCDDNAPSVVVYTHSQ